MQNGMDGQMNGTMGGYGPWPWLGALLAVFLILAIITMVRQK